MAIAGTHPRPSSGELRWFGILVLAVFLLLGGLLGWQLDSTRVTSGFWGIGLALAALYYAVRPLRLPLYLAWMAVTLPIGRFISYLILGAIYFLVVTPIALTARLFGRDRMARRFDAVAESYWSEHDANEDVGRYFRQS